MLPGGQGILYHALDETGRPSRDFGPAGPRTRVPAGFQRYHSTPAEPGYGSRNKCEDPYQARCHGRRRD